MAIGDSMAIGRMALGSILNRDFLNRQCLDGPIANRMAQS
jgi:hypothetical protein